MTAAPDVFLSYNREDAAVAKLYADAFAHEGLDVWWDQTLRSGEAYDKVTEAALRGARAVVVLWSPRSVDSRWVRAEATIADRHGTLMPATIEPCERPVMFELTQTADLSHWRGEAGDPAWQAFLADVRRMAGGDHARPAAIAPAATSTSVGQGIAVVAVLPIAHRPGDEELALLAEDLTEDVTRELGQNPFFEVIAASAAAAGRDKASDGRTRDRRLEASYLIECRLQRAGEQLRLTAQLIDAATGGMLQSARLSRSSSEIEASPEEFPGAVAANLGVLILQIEMNRAVAKQGPLTGWDHILRARACTQSTGSENSRIFIDEARQAVAALPDLNLAHAMLASALGAAVGTGHRELDDALSREIQAHIKRAFQFGVINPVAIGYLAVAYKGLGDGEACLRLARRAVELSPNSPRAQYLVADALTIVGRTADAIEAFKQLDRLSPTDDARLGSFTSLGLCHFLEGELAEADAALDRALAFQADSFWALKWKAIVAASRGDESAALAAVRRLREVEPELSIDDHIHQMLFNRQTAERMTEPAAILRRLWETAEGEG